MLFFSSSAFSFFIYLHFFFFTCRPLILHCIIVIKTQSFSADGRFAGLEKSFSLSCKIASLEYGF